MAYAMAYKVFGNAVNFNAANNELPFMLRNEDALKVHKSFVLLSLIFLQPHD